MISTSHSITTGYQPYIHEVTEAEALTFFLHHATLAAAYFEITDLTSLAICDHISTRFLAGTVEHRALIAYTNILDYIYGD